MRWGLVFFYFVLFTPWAEAQQEGFVAGVSAYNQKDFEKAQASFSNLLQENPENPTLLYNLGLVEYQLGRFGMALGLWRKARMLDPGLAPPRRAIEFAEERLFPDHGAKPFIVTLYDWLLKLPLWAWCLGSIMSFLIAGWFSLEYGVKKRLTPNLWPTWLFFVFPVFLFTTFFATLDYLHANQTMATVISKETATRTTPSASAPTLSPLQEGQVVQVEKIIGEWAQIRTLSGAPGWVPQNTLIMFRGL